MSNAGLIVVDNSTLKLTVCTTKVILRRHLGYTSLEEAIHAYCGNAVHSAIARHLGGHHIVDLNMECFAEDYEQFSAQWVQPKKLVRYGQETEVANRIRFENVRDIMRAWIVGNPLHTLPWVPQQIEYSMRAMLSPYVQYVGKLDVLGVDRSGRLVVVDHKTTGRLSSDWWAQWNLDGGCTGYIWLASEFFKVPVSKITLYINGIELSELPRSDRACKTHGGKFSECSAQHARWGQEMFTRTEEQVEEWKSTATRMALKYRSMVAEYESTKDLKALPQEGTVIGSCNDYDGCEFRRFCSAKRPLHLLDVLLQHEPWEPWPGAFQEEAC